MLFLQFSGYKFRYKKVIAYPNLISTHQRVGYWQGLPVSLQSKSIDEVLPFSYSFNECHPDNDEVVYSSENLKPQFFIQAEFNNLERFGFD